VFRYQLISPVLPVKRFVIDPNPYLVGFPGLFRCVYDAYPSPAEFISVFKINSAVLQDMKRINKGRHYSIVANSLRRNKEQNVQLVDFVFLGGLQIITFLNEVGSGILRGVLLLLSSPFHRKIVAAGKKIQELKQISVSRGKRI